MKGKSSSKRNDDGFYGQVAHRGGGVRKDPMDMMMQMERKMFGDVESMFGGFFDSGSRGGSSMGVFGGFDDILSGFDDIRMPSNKFDRSIGNGKG